MLTTREQNYFNRLIRESKSELDSIKIKYSTEIQFSTFKSARSFGRCTQFPNGNFGIKITEALIKTRNDKSIKDTIIHELLHTCKDSMCHTGNWKRNAEKVNRLLGYNIKRLSSYEEKGMEKESTFKYAGICNSCGHKYYFKKITKCIKAQGIGYQCGICKASSNFSFYTL